MTTDSRTPPRPRMSHRVQRLDGSELEISSGARLIIEPMGTERKILTEFVGMVRGKFILTRLPTRPEDRVFFVPESLVTVKYVHGGHNVSAFRTEVTGISLKPYPLLYLAVPDSVEILNLRKSDRVHCFLPTTAYVDGNELAGLIVNISAGGCKLVIESSGSAPPPQVPEESEIVTNFHLFDKDTQIFAQGMVRSCEQGENAASLGVQFKDLAQDIQDNIDGYVRKISRYLMD